MRRWDKARSRRAAPWAVVLAVLTSATAFLALGAVGLGRPLAVGAREAALTDPAPPWPQFGHDAQHTGRSSHPGPRTPYVKWRAPWWSGVFSSPVVGSDGTVYVAADGQLVAVDPSGNERWRTETGSCVGSPAVAKTLRGEVVYATGTDDTGARAVLYAVRSDTGTVIWRFPKAGDTQADSSQPLPFSATVGPDGTVYFGVAAPDGTSGVLYAVTPDGDPSWQFPTESIHGSVPAVAADGTVYVGAGRTLYAVRDGSQEWSFQTGGDINSPPVVADDGTVYVGSSDGQLYALHPQKGRTQEDRKRWSRFVGPLKFSSAALASDGRTLYVGAGEALVALNAATGTVVWQTACLRGGIVNSSPAVSSDGRVLVQTGRIDVDASVRSVLCSVDQGTSGTHWTVNTQSSGRMSPLVSSPSLGGDGLIYVGSADGTLYAFSDTPLGVSAPAVPLTIKPGRGVIRRACGSVEAGALTVAATGSAVATDTSFAVDPQPVRPASGDLLPILGFSITANNGSTSQVAEPITLVLRYNDAAIGCVDERTLAIYSVASDNARERLPCSVDTAANVLRCSTGHLSDFEVMALQAGPGRTPSPVPSPCAGCLRSLLPLLPKEGTAPWVCPAGQVAFGRTGEPSTRAR
jgi:outer membrane protein assembly factor BamB